MLADCPTGGVLVTHSPPLDTVDHDSSGRIRGSDAIRKVMLQQKPQLVVCGHIHSDWGRQIAIGPTRVLNAGPSGVIVEIGQTPLEPFS